MQLSGTSPAYFLLYTLIIFIALLIRYFVAAGLFYYYYNIIHSKKYTPKKLSRKKLRKRQIRKEISYSIKSSAIFAVFGAGVYWLWLRDLTAIYLDPAAYPYWYLPVSLILIFLIHETYYYWVHRWMHHPKIFKKVHKVHHESITPTAWTAFSFHPWECFLEALILPLILISLPVNIFVLAFYLLVMTLSSVINHLDIEIYPEFFLKSKLGKLVIGATHHHYHHEEFQTNYGLYFTFWDKWMKTESSKMEAIENPD